MGFAHYLEALDFQREIIKIHTVFGGKNPHPNWIVGGMPCAINIDQRGAVGAVDMERLNWCSRSSPAPLISSTTSWCLTRWLSASSASLEPDWHRAF